MTIVTHRQNILNPSHTYIIQTSFIHTLTYIFGDMKIMVNYALKKIPLLYNHTLAM